MTVTGDDQYSEVCAVYILRSTRITGRGRIAFSAMYATIVLGFPLQQLNPNPDYKISTDRT